jgi:hypothetical protein
MSKGRKYSMPAPAGGMMREFQRLQEELDRAREALAEETVTISVGGGAVTIEMTGTQVCRAVKLAPEVLASADADLLADMLLAAFNQAVEASQALAAKRLGPLTDVLSRGTG